MMPLKMLMFGIYVRFLGCKSLSINDHQFALFHPLNVGNLMTEPWGVTLDIMQKLMLFCKWMEWIYFFGIYLPHTQDGTAPHHQDDNKNMF